MNDHENTQGETQCTLNLYQDIHILVDDGSENRFGAERILRAEVEKEFAKKSKFSSRLVFY